MFLGRDALEGDMVFGKGILKVLGTFVFQNLEVSEVAMGIKKLVDLIPGSTDESGLVGGKRDGIS